jgi:KTSC domain
MLFVHPTPKSTSTTTTSFDTETKTLSVTFRNGKSYKYLGVPPEKFNQLKDAASTGHFINGNIKPHYKCVPI